MVYQLMKRSKELRRDIEFVLTNNQAPSPALDDGAAAATALRLVRDQCRARCRRRQRLDLGGGDRRNAARPHRIAGQVADPGGVDTRRRARPHHGRAVQQTVISAFTGNNTRTQDHVGQEADRRESTSMSAISAPTRCGEQVQPRPRPPILTADLWAMASLRPIQTLDLAKTGDAEKGMVLCEYTLEARNEAGSAIVADLTTS